MPFQPSPLRQFQTTGIPGEIAREGPLRALPWNLNPAGTASKPSTIGYAFTKQADKDAVVGSGGVFVGILMHSKEHALVGSGIDPTLVLPDGTVGSLLTMGIIFVDAQIVTLGTVGAGVFFVDTTGAIGLGAAGAGQTQIPNAVVAVEDITAPGLAIIELTS